MSTLEKATAINNDIEPSNLSRKDIDEIATKVVTITGFQPGDDLVGVVKKLRGTIELDEKEEHEHGSIVVRGKNDFTIYLPTFTGPLRDRFTIAHELGHYVLHSRLGQKSIIVPRYGKNLVETEANYFAGGFLMPKEMFIKAYYECGGDRRYLAAMFLVSEAAVRVREKTLEKWGDLLPIPSQRNA
jgi:hypothetical protein